MVRGLTSQTVGRLLPIAAVALLVALGGLYVSGRIATESDPENFVPSDSKVLRDLHKVRDTAGSTSELNLLIESDGKVTDQATLDWMLDYVDRQVTQHPELMRSNSLATLARQLTSDRPTTASARQAIGTAPDALVRSVVSEDGHMANITFAISGDQSLDEQKALTRAVVDDAAPPEGVTIAPAGISVIGTESVDALSANRDLMSFVALLAIFGVLLLAYRNIVRAMAPLVPVVLALGASSMLLYLTGIEYSPLTSISGPLIIAMGTEFNVLLMSRYFEEREAGAAALR
jgi:predicted RND superfamily exporter protein